MEQIETIWRLAIALMSSKKIWLPATLPTHETGRLTPQKLVLQSSKPGLYNSSEPQPLTVGTRDIIKHKTKRKPQESVLQDSNLITGSSVNVKTALVCITPVLSLR